MSKMNVVKITKGLSLIFSIVFVITSATPAFAGAPICNVDGGGGVGVTATAWITSSSNDTSFLDGWIQKPTIGMWHGYFRDINTDFNAYCLNFGVKNQVEFSCARATASVENGPTIKMDSFGAKINLIKENAFSSPFVPAVSVGATYRVNHDIQGMDDDKGLEYYLVASKIVPKAGPLPFPLILNAGAIYTDAQQRGIFGFNDDNDFLWFFDLCGIVPLFPKWDYFTTCFPGVECRSGASYDDGYKEEDTWIAYCDLLATDNLIIALAHIWNGNPKNKNPFSRSKVGLGDAFIFMLDYDF